MMKSRKTTSPIARVPLSTKKRFIKVVDHKNQKHKEQGDRTATDIFTELIETEYENVFGERR